MNANEKRPKITMMGEEVPWEDFPDARALDFADHFKPVKLSPRAINEASKIVPIECWIKQGLYKWLSQRADHVFAKLSTDQREGKLGIMRYVFEFDESGPVLKDVKLG